MPSLKYNIVYSKKVKQSKETIEYEIISSFLATDKGEVILGKGTNTVLTMVGWT